MEHPLSSLFLPACPPGGAPAPGPALEAALKDALQRAQTAWPDVKLPPGVYMPHLAARLDGPDGLASLKVDDLYVACACLHGDGRAIAAIETRYFGDIDGALRKMNFPTPKIDDVKQTIRRQLFVGDGDEPPKIGAYNGKGDLRSWLRVSAVRAALKVIRKEKRETLVDDEALFEAGTRDADPELAYIKEVYRDKFKAAFQSALDSLEDREKNMLRQHIVDGLSIDDLAALYQVHRATAARWLVKAKETLLDRTRKTFMKNARISRGECDSILRMVHSQLDATIRRRLKGVG